MVRVARRRFIGRSSAMDVVVAVTFGSTLSRGLTGNAPLWPVLAACGVLVAADCGLAIVGARWDRFDCWVKGRAVDVVRDGRADPAAMAGLSVSPRDLAEGLRLHGKTDDPAAVAPGDRRTQRPVQRRTEAVARAGRRGPHRGRRAGRAGGGRVTRGRAVGR